ncbi:unnamed protein product [Ectocarpus sp. 12 AP-2014]
MSRGGERIGRTTRPLGRSRPAFTKSKEEACRGHEEDRGRGLLLYRRPILLATRGRLRVMSSSGSRRQVRAVVHSVHLLLVDDDSKRNIRHPATMSMRRPQRRWRRAAGRTRCARPKQRANEGTTLPCAERYPSSLPTRAVET